MAIKTFNVGEVLTATDTNTYLANAGLVYVKSQAVTGTPTSVTVTGAFSSDYDNYKIVYTGGTLSSDNAIELRLGSSTANYYSVLIFANIGSGAASIASDNNASRWTLAGGGSYATVNVDLFRPNLAQWTDMTARVRYGTVWGQTQGLLLDTTQYTEFTLIGAGGTATFSGGTITVYGYRKA